MTPQQIAACTGSSLKLATLYAPFFNFALPDFEINTPLRQAAFLSQVGHESGGLVYTSEIWGPTKEQKTYERDLTAPWGPQLKRGDRNFKPYTLGNAQPGDGRKFAGHGLIQLTGRNNHYLASKALATDFIDNPLLLTEPDMAVRSACWFWQTHGLNELADACSYITITKRINGGTNGLEDRQRLYAAALPSLGVSNGLA